MSKIMYMDKEYCGYPNVDYIVEQGTSGNWDYRKWASGKSEAWYSGSQTLSTSTMGNLHGSANNTLAIPSGIFNSAPTYVVASIHNRQSSFVSVGLEATAEDTIKYQIYSTSALSSVSVPFSIYAVGTWI